MFFSIIYFKDLLCAQENTGRRVSKDVIVYHQGLCNIRTHMQTHILYRNNIVGQTFFCNPKAIGKRKKKPIIRRGAQRYIGTLRIFSLFVFAVVVLILGSDFM